MALCGGSNWFRLVFPQFLVPFFGLLLRHADASGADVLCGNSESDFVVTCNRVASWACWDHTSVTV